MYALKWLAPAALVLVTASMTCAREWKDATGQVSGEGEFVSCRAGRVYVRLTDGRQLSAAFQQFSAEDQAYVWTLARAAMKQASQSARTEARPVPVRTANYQSGTLPDVSSDSRYLPDAEPAPAGGLPPLDEGQPVPAAGQASVEARQPASSQGQAPIDRGQPVPAQEQAEAAAPPVPANKFVFYTECGTFHLLFNDPNTAPINGTAHYSIPCYMPAGCGWYCCHHCCGPWYLSFLRVTRYDRTLTEVQEVGSASKIKYWRFIWRPGGCYRVMFSTATNNDADFKPFGMAHRVQLK